MWWGAWPGSNLPFASAALEQERRCADALVARFAFPKPEMPQLDQALTWDPPTPAETKAWAGHTHNKGKEIQLRDPVAKRH